MSVVLIPLGLIAIGMLLRLGWLHAKAASSRVQAKEAKRAETPTVEEPHPVAVEARSAGACAAS